MGIYFLGVFIITIVAALIVLAPEALDLESMDYISSFLVAILTFLFGQLFWRLICELWIIIFRIAASLSNIENQLKKQNKTQNIKWT